MAMKAKHAFGKLSDVQSALKSGKIDAYDILFLDGDTEPKVGWVDRNGNFRLVENSADLSELEAELSTKVDSAELSEVLSELEAQLESQLATKVSAKEVEEKLSTKADAAEVEEKLSTKVNAVEVDEKIEKATTDTVATAKAYTDGKVEAALSEHLVKKFEITNTPIGTIVDYRENEIRVMCPVGTVFTKQNVGSTGNANMYYMGFKAYAPDGAVSFKEGDRGVIIDEMFDFNGAFSGTDEYGRNYSICWLALASCDGSGVWTYYGKNSSKEKYIGWDYVVEWYDADGVMIASDSVRINLSNEECHFVNEPYFVGKMMKEVDVKIEEKLAEIDSAWKIVEF